MPNTGDRYPSKPYGLYAVTLSKSAAQSYTDNVLTKLTFDGNQDIYPALLLDYDFDQQVYSPKVPGLYSIALQIFSSLAYNGERSLYIYKNGSLFQTVWRTGAGEGSYMNTYCGLTVLHPIFLDVNDYLEFYFNFVGNGTASTITASSNIFIRRIFG